MFAFSAAEEHRQILPQIFDGNRKVQALVLHDTREHDRLHAHLRVYEGAAGIPGVHRGVYLKNASRRKELSLDVRYDALRKRTAESERCADRGHPVADSQFRA